MALILDTERRSAVLKDVQVERHVDGHLDLEGHLERLSGRQRHGVVLGLDVPSVGEVAVLANDFAGGIDDELIGAATRRVRGGAVVRAKEVARVTRACRREGHCAPATTDLLQALSASGQRRWLILAAILVTAVAEALAIARGVCATVLCLVGEVVDESAVGVGAQTGTIANVRIVGTANVVGVESVERNRSVKSRERVIPEAITSAIDGSIGTANIVRGVGNTVDDGTEMEHLIGVAASAKAVAVGGATARADAGGWIGM